MPVISIHCSANNTSARNERGGLMARYTNKSGAASVKGELVECSETTAYGVNVCTTSCVDVIGVVYESGVADGDQVWVVISGPAQVLLEDSTAATVGYWAARGETTAGRADCSASAPPGGGIVLNNEAHLEREIGHCMESVTAGTDKLCWVHLHFN